MIQISTWVLATDGLLYRDPVIRTKTADGRDAFLCFCDSEPPELVVEARESEPLPARREAVAMLAAMGLSARVISEPLHGVRCFGPDAATGPYARAYSFFLDITSPIPAVLMPGRGQAQPSGGGCAVYSFGKKWG